MLRAFAHPRVAFATRMVTIAAIILSYSYKIAIPLAETAFLADNIAAEAREFLVVRTAADLAAHPGSTAAQIAERLGGGTRTIGLLLRGLTRSRIAAETGDSYTLT